ncbi:MAG: PEP-CTERM sorting domain-containing protein [Acidobacteriota bacterium]
MKLLSKISITIAALAFLGVASGSAFADGIVLVSPDKQKLVPPIAALNFEHHGHVKTESGGVVYTGSGDLAFGDISAGPHQHTVSFTELGLSRASDLRVLLNINEANGTDKMPITIDSLVLTAYDQSGNAVFTASLVNGPLSLDQFKQAQGSTSDYLFALDSVAAARLQAALDSNPALRLGLSASLSNVDGGPERFSFTGTAGPVPEPATIVLFGTSLAGLAGAVRRRRKAAQLAKIAGAAETS